MDLDKNFKIENPMLVLEEEVERDLMKVENSNRETVNLEEMETTLNAPINLGQESLSFLQENKENEGILQELHNLHVSSQGDKEKEKEKEKDSQIFIQNEQPTQLPNSESSKEMPQASTFTTDKQQLSNNLPNQSPNEPTNEIPKETQKVKETQTNSFVTPTKNRNNQALLSGQFTPTSSSKLNSILEQLGDKQVHSPCKIPKPTHSLGYERKVKY